MGKKNRNNTRPPVGLWGMLRDVLVASMNKGQFPVALLALIVIVIILKMPQEDVSRLAFAALEALRARELFGYILALLALLGWFGHARWQRRQIAGEMERMGREKSTIQGKALDQKLPSSNRG